MQKPAKFLVLIDAGGAMVARLFDEGRVQVAEFEPDFKEDALQTGVTVARGARLSMQLSKGERTACEFRTAGFSLDS